MTTTPDATPQKEGLLASAYRTVTAPFSMGAPKNVTTRHKKRKSSLSKILHINEIADNLTLKAENPSATSLGASSLNDSMKMLRPNEMYLLNTQCEKCIAEEVQFYFKSYEEFVNCKNDRFKTVISALNVANAGHYNDLRIKYPDFMLEPPLVDINKLVQVIQNVYPAQVVQYSLGTSKKDEKEGAKESNASTAGDKASNNVGLFLPKVRNKLVYFHQIQAPKIITNLVSI